MDSYTSDTGTLGGTVSDSDGETSSTLGGFSTPSQDNANYDANSLGYGLSSDNNFSENPFGFFSGPNENYSNEGRNFSSNPNNIENSSFSDPNNFFRKFLKMGLGLGLQKAGVSPNLVNGLSTLGQAAQADTPTQAAQTVGKGAFNGILGATGFGLPLGLLFSGLNKLNTLGTKENMDAGQTPAPAPGMSTSSSDNMLGGLASLYGYNRANSAAKDQINSLSGMYGQDSPYAQMLRQQLSRKDAAGGRRSQYGPREVELQARLAHLASGNANAIGQLRQGQNQMRAQGLAQLMQFMNKSGATQGISNGLQGLFNSGMTSGVSNGWLPSNDVGMTDTPFPATDDYGFGG